MRTAPNNLFLFRTSESAEELEPGEIVEDPIDMSTFSFEYDPIKDTHLLAKNCEQQIVNDPVCDFRWKFF